MADATRPQCARCKLASEYALGVLRGFERDAFAAHLRECVVCRGELVALQPIIEAVVDWPKDIVAPPVTLWDRLAQRIGIAAGSPDVARAAWVDDGWLQVAPGIEYKTLARDRDAERIAMLVRLAPCACYPPHAHAGVEELYLLDGELWIDDRKLYPGDYSCAAAGTEDRRVWSETGCTCVLITSLGDLLGGYVAR